MISFLETPRFPEQIGYGSAGGPQFSTDITEVASGFEIRNINWSTDKMRFEIDESIKTQDQVDVFLAFFRAVKGRGIGFRMKDFTDFQATILNGVLGTGIGTGMPAYQLQKKYVTGAEVHFRKIVKPVVGTLTVYRNGSPVIVGTDPGEIAIDTTTGLITFVSDNTQAITAITVGTSTIISIAAAQAELLDEDYVYIDGVGGTVGAVLNGKAHHIISKVGSGSLSFTIDVNTVGLSWTSGGSCYAYPQASEPLTAAYEFDVPVRFDTDNPMIVAVDYNQFDFGPVEIVELRL